MLASPAMNMPILCRPYNPFSPAPNSIQSMASSPNYAHSPGNSSTYSASPINSPQQHYTQEELMMRYGAMRQPMVPAGFAPQPPQMQSTSEYAYFYIEYGMKRRKRDNEVSNKFLVLYPHLFMFKQRKIELLTRRGKSFTVYQMCLIDIHLLTSLYFLRIRDQKK